MTTGGAFSSRFSSAHTDGNPTSAGSWAGEAWRLLGFDTPKTHHPRLGY